MSDKRKITRMDAVRDQLDTAYKAYFLWDDLVSAITLAGAAERVLSDMQPRDGIFGVDPASLRSFINLYVKPGYHKQIGALYRADYDFFRHADKKTQADYEIKETVADFFLLIPLLSFEFLKQQKTHAMRTYLQWFFYRYPQFLKDSEDTRFITSTMDTRKAVTQREFYENRCALDTEP